MRADWTRCSWPFRSDRYAAGDTDELSGFERLRDAETSVDTLLPNASLQKLSDSKGLQTLSRTRPLRADPDVTAL